MGHVVPNAKGTAAVEIAGTNIVVRFPENVVHPVRFELATAGDAAYRIARVCSLGPKGRCSKSFREIHRTALWVLTTRAMENFARQKEADARGRTRATGR